MARLLLHCSELRMSSVTGRSSSLGSTLCTKHSALATPGLSPWNEAPTPANDLMVEFSSLALMRAVLERLPCASKAGKSHFQWRDFANLIHGAKANAIIGEAAVMGVTETLLSEVAVTFDVFRRPENHVSILASGTPFHGTSEMSLVCNPRTIPTGIPPSREPHAIAARAARLRRSDGGGSRDVTSHWATSKGDISVNFVLLRQSFRLASVPRPVLAALMFPVSKPPGVHRSSTAARAPASVSAVAGLGAVGRGNCADPESGAARAIANMTQAR